jgi:hypothetical protein
MYEYANRLKYGLPCVKDNFSNVIKLSSTKVQIKTHFACTQLQHITCFFVKKNAWSLRNHLTPLHCILRGGGTEILDSEWVPQWIVYEELIIGCAYNAVSKARHTSRNRNITITWNVINKFKCFLKYYNFLNVWESWVCEQSSQGSCSNRLGYFTNAIFLTKCILLKFSFFHCTHKSIGASHRQRTETNHGIRSFPGCQKCNTHKVYWLNYRPYLHINAVCVNYYSITPPRLVSFKETGIKWFLCGNNIFQER